MLDIEIKTIPHGKQRYDTVGDWYYHNGKLLVFISAMGDWRKEISIAVHELIECFSCKSAGIDAKDVDKFDMAYEANRKEGEYKEPGDSPHAPYHEQHVFATNIERLFVQQLDLEWGEYEDAINLL